MYAATWSRLQRQLFEDIMHVASDRISGEMELVRDLLVAHPGRDQIDHLPFPLRQPYGFERMALALSHRRVSDLREERDGQWRRENIGTLGHRPNGTEKVVQRGGFQEEP